MFIPKVITHFETTQPVAALTFDDGPDPVSTPRVLEILDRFGAQATFFMVGRKAREFPHIVRRVAEAGHAIGNHSWGHADLTQIPSRLRRLKQMLACGRAIAPYHTRLFRPPFGAHNRQILGDAALLRYKVILWNASAQDWKTQTADTAAQKMIDRINPGTIFLLHDAIESPARDGIERDRSTMLKGLEWALGEMGSRLRFVTVSEMFRHGRPGCRWPLQQMV